MAAGNVAPLLVSISPHETTDIGSYQAAIDRLNSALAAALLAVATPSPTPEAIATEHAASSQVPPHDNGDIVPTNTSEQDLQGEYLSEPVPTDIPQQEVVVGADDDAAFYVLLAAATLVSVSLLVIFVVFASAHGGKSGESSTRDDRAAAEATAANVAVGTFVEAAMNPDSEGLHEMNAAMNRAVRKLVEAAGLQGPLAEDNLPAADAFFRLKQASAAAPQEASWAQDAAAAANKIERAMERARQGVKAIPAGALEVHGAHLSQEHLVRESDRLAKFSDGFLLGCRLGIVAWPEDAPVSLPPMLSSAEDDFTSDGGGTVVDTWLPAVFHGTGAGDGGKSDVWALPLAAGKPGEWAHAGNLMSVLCRGSAELERLRRASADLKEAVGAVAREAGRVGTAMRRVREAVEVGVGGDLPPRLFIEGGGEDGLQAAGGSGSAEAAAGAGAIEEVEDGGTEGPVVEELESDAEGEAGDADGHDGAGVVQEPGEEGGESEEEEEVIGAGPGGQGAGGGGLHAEAHGGWADETDERTGEEGISELGDGLSPLVALQSALEHLRTALWKLDRADAGMHAAVIGHTRLPALTPAGRAAMDRAAQLQVRSKAAREQALEAIQRASGLLPNGDGGRRRTSGRKAMPALEDAEGGAPLRRINSDPGGSPVHVEPPEGRGHMRSGGAGGALVARTISVGAQGAIIGAGAGAAADPGEGIMTAIALQTLYQNMASQARHEDGKRHDQVIAAERETKDSWRHAESMAQQQAASKVISDELQVMQRQGVAAQVRAKAERLAEILQEEAVEDREAGLRLLVLSVASALGCSTVLLLARFSLSELVPDCADFLAGASGAGGPVGLGFAMDWAMRSVDFMRVVGYSQCFLWFAAQVLGIVLAAYAAGMFSRQLQTGLLAAAVMYASRSTLAVVAGRSYWALLLPAAQGLFYVCARLTGVWSVTAAEEKRMVRSSSAHVPGGGGDGFGKAGVGQPQDADPSQAGGHGDDVRADGTPLATRTGRGVGARLVSRPELLAAASDRRGLLFGLVGRSAWMGVLWPALAVLAGIVVGGLLACEGWEELEAAVGSLRGMLLAVIGGAGGGMGYASAGGYDGEAADRLGMARLKQAFEEQYGDLD